MYEFTIPGISGGPDQKAIIGAVLALDGNATLDFNWATQKVSVKSSADLAEISEMLLAIGYQIEKIAHRLDGDSAHHCDQCD
jgi:hypothetical protein